MQALLIVEKKALVGALVFIILLSHLLIFPVSAESAWVKPRPSGETIYNDVIGNSAADGAASIGVGVHIHKYEEGEPDDHIHFRVSTSANTRKDIQYNTYPESYNWYDVSQPTGITGDDSGVNLTLPFPVLYYGVEYNFAWVCSNGFLSFDCASTSPTPVSIPNTNKPNSTVAVFWRDLNPAAGGSITWGVLSEAEGFVISWNNVPNKSNGVPQTFQVIIRNRGPGAATEYHNWIIFQYKSITRDCPTTVGIEDQVGDKGTAYDVNSLQNGSSHLLKFPRFGYRVEELTVKLTKSDSHAKIQIEDTYLEGYNVILEEPNDLGQDTFTLAIRYAAAQLIGGGKAGIIFKTFLVFGDAVDILARALSKPDPVFQSADENHNEAHFTGTGSDENHPAQRPFDSTVASEVIWYFLDDNNLDHDVSITAELKYCNDLGDYHVISTSAALKMYIPSSSPPMGGGYCPFVSVWDGSGYVPDNNVLPRSVLSGGTDVEDYYRLEKTPVHDNGKYLLRLTEFASDHSYFDKVNLLAVDHESDVDIAITPEGEILTYKNPAAPTSAIDNYGNNRLGETGLMDGNVSDPATYFKGFADDYLVLNFGQVSSDNAKLILRTDIKKNVMDDQCILVQVKNGSGVWQTVETLVPRAYWSMEAVNLSPYIVQGKDFTVRLYWLQPHRLDYAGLDTTPQASYDIRSGTLVSATHSAQGNVKPQLSNNDSVYVELVPGQQIQLEFTLPNNSKEARTYIFHSKGHYNTIP